MDLIEIDKSALNSMTNYEKMCSSESYTTSIVRYLHKDLSYNDFFMEIMAKNVPCLISSVTSQWGGLNWIEDQKPDFGTLIQQLGKLFIDCVY